MQVFVLEVTTHLTMRNPNKKLTQKSAITDSYNVIDSTFLNGWFIVFALTSEPQLWLGSAVRSALASL